MPQNLGHVACFERRLFRAGKFQQIGHHRVQAVNFLNHDAQIGFVLRVKRQFALKILQKAFQRAERIADFMRDARRQPANRGQTLRALDLRLQGAHFA